MRIAIDARSLSHPQPGGFKTYTTELVRALLNEDDTHDYTLYLDRPLNGATPRGRANAAPVVLPVRGGWAGVPLREQVSLPRALLRQAPDVVHFPTATAPVMPLGPTVVTLHDAIEFIEKPPLRLSAEGVRRLLMSHYNQGVQRLVGRQAAAIITVSNYSKADLVQTLGIPAHKIHVIPNAYAEHFRPLPRQAALETARRRYDLPPAFILSLVSASPRKNAAGLLRSYARLPVELRQQYPLVMLWTHRLLQPSIQAEIERLGLTGSVSFLASVPDEDLAALYNAATAFVFPSLYEGFGLPVLEAMACGAPVVASNRTSIPEIAGDAAALVDPADEAGFAAALADVLTDVGRRAWLSAAGLRRAGEFSWRRTAQMTLEVYREVAGESRKSQPA